MTERSEGMLPSGFEPESPARKAGMIGRYTTGAPDSTVHSGGGCPQPNITYISCERQMQYRIPCLGDICLVRKEIRADAVGFEPTACGLGGRRPIQARPRAHDVRFSPIMQGI